MEETKRIKQTIASGALGLKIYGIETKKMFQFRPMSNNSKREYILRERKRQKTRRMNNIDREIHGTKPPSIIVVGFDEIGSTGEKKNEMEG